MHRQNRHSWKEECPDGIIFYRAILQAKVWHLSYQLKEEDEWITVAEPTLEQWKSLRDVLWRKYQRRRLPWKQIEKLDQQIEAMADEIPPGN